MNVLFYLIGEGETLLVVLLLLYLSECLIWVKRESVQFSNWFQLIAFQVMVMRILVKLW